MRLNILQSIANSKSISRFEIWAAKDRPIKGNMRNPETNYELLQKIYPTAAMLLAVSSQTVFIYKSKEMPKERKYPLVLNTVITTILATAGGVLSYMPIDKLMNKFVERASVLYANNPNKINLINGAKTAIPFLASAVLFKYIGAVLATPLADKANNFLVKKKLINYDAEKTTLKIKA